MNIHCCKQIKVIIVDRMLICGLVLIKHTHVRLHVYYYVCVSVMSCSTHMVHGTMNFHFHEFPIIDNSVFTSATRNGKLSCTLLHSTIQLVRNTAYAV